MDNEEKQNNLPLVRRQPSAIEKAAPGAKRILSGMVADTPQWIKGKTIDSGHCENDHFSRWYVLGRVNTN